ncbi:hypothetical protein Pst134EA_019682 [Puccinia striiformis f. sp. tritici]|uniref:hypothetical protein n=1 Tax=Puccinia striiformis f. sp. tritici TaxID=168172 RepID=UPI002007204E|nr:hypothetical protein Pst134EA_019682 [Puccinia striiformis f. sp. tritici]KAH9449782.1 hypothetical protein Pst134EB_020597 [Puccinia striiformis f. sp. tritici]KAH9459533.1 hypothetical protein Pst134EA_019682 [Puccinia striiformis f. sp. tritici]
MFNKQTHHSSIESPQQRQRKANIIYNKNKIPNFSIGLLEKEFLERKAKNLRRLAAVYVGKKSAGFKVVHGLLDRVMAMLEISWSEDGSSNPLSSKRGQYRIEESNC